MQIVPLAAAPSRWSGGVSFSALLLGCAALLGMFCVPACAQSTSVYGKDFEDAVVSPETILAPAPTAAFSAYVTKPAGFGSGLDALGLHYAISLTDNVSGKFLRKFAFAAASHQREQYVAMGGGHTIWQRVGHAALHSIFATTEDGSRGGFNWSALPASAAGAGLSNAYQPAEQRTLSATMARLGTNAGSYIAGDIWLEFTAKPRQHVVFRSVFKSR